MVKDFSFVSNIKFTLEKNISVAVHYIKLTLFLMCSVYHLQFFI